MAPIPMLHISTRRVYEPASPRDGLRILVDRLWPRGMSKEAAALDLWAQDVAPSEALRKWFDHRPERFAEFKRRYTDELQSNRALCELKDYVGRSKATLLFGAKDLEFNQAVVLAEVLSAQVG